MCSITGVSLRNSSPLHVQQYTSCAAIANVSFGLVTCDSHFIFIIFTDMNKTLFSLGHSIIPIICLLKIMKTRLPAISFSKQAKLSIYMCCALSALGIGSGGRYHLLASATATGPGAWPRGVLSLGRGLSCSVGFLIVVQERYCTSTNLWLTPL